jgi:hypothetical protein
VGEFNPRLSQQAFSCGKQFLGSVAGTFRGTSLERELPIAVGTIDATIIPKGEIDTRMTERTAIAVATDGRFVNFNNFGRLNGHEFTPDTD